MFDAEVHYVSVASGVYGGNNDLLYLCVFISKVNVFNNLVPVYPFASSFKLRKSLHHNLSTWH